MFNEILNHIELFEEHKGDILDMWLGYDIVKKTLNDHDFSVVFFKERFASNVFDFMISVIKSEKEMGNCPVMGIMLALFKKKNIPLCDVFLICVHLKNSMLRFANKNSLLDDNMLTEISMIMDYNFSGVINEYVKLYYDDTTADETFKRESSNPTDKKVPLKYEDTDLRVSAEVYLRDINYDPSLIMELEELESDVLFSLDMGGIGEETDQNLFLLSSSLFKKYSKVLHTMLVFDKLADTLSTLTKLLCDIDIKSMDKEIQKTVPIYIKAIISDLQRWRISVFIAKDAEDIHYLDKTLFGSIAQLHLALMVESDS